MRDELLNMIADTHNGQMHRDLHAMAGNNSVFYFRDAIREALEREAVCLPNDPASLQAQLEETQRQLAEARASVSALLADATPAASDLEDAARYHQEDAIRQLQEKRALARQLEETQRQLEQARADYAMLRGVARLCFGESASDKSARDLFNLVTTNAHPGAALNIRFNRMKAKLEAAHAVIAAAAKLDGNGTTDAAWEKLWGELEAYDVASAGLEASTHEH